MHVRKSLCQDGWATKPFQMLGQASYNTNRMLHACNLCLCVCLCVCVCSMCVCACGYHMHVRKSLCQDGWETKPF
jgi:hypothetical protein